MYEMIVINTYAIRNYLQKIVSFLYLYFFFCYFFFIIVCHSMWIFIVNGYKCTCVLLSRYGGNKSIYI